ncbi:Arylsulfatase [Maioricimonas rarisocia]|uniref:Arylsulfatase n=1 Tax=Maioricimonas rarisocia TaxID=2528026 RepID=A0A517Z0X6_9PLAN|nr:sulfatase-like hydrolase/transferase [Maioricimonas rarisocia]QDU36137.1 Arylsulfatase [Maioricimonas rarisocia]
MMFLRVARCVLWLMLVIGVTPDGIADSRPPNIVFVLADDLGWSELGCYGNTFHETPHLDQLTADGMKFTQAYAATPVCSPYRAALLTGQHPARLGILDYLRPNSANALSTETVTLPEILQQHGYVTGMIGKWHLTGYEHHGARHESRPRDHGFAWDFAREVKGVGNGANFWPYVFRDQPIRWIDIPANRLGDQEYLTDRMNLEAVDFIERERDRPFFLYLSHYAPHSILNGKPDLVDKYRRKHPPGPSTRERCDLCQDQGHAGDPLHHWAGDHNPHLAAMLESIDEGIGMIRSRLDELGLAGNTIIIFTSDNGGETNVTSNAPLRGGKSELYEGGIRVPLIVRWPAVVPEGTVCSRPTMNVDFFPTLLEAAGIAVDESQPLDGVSILSSLRNGSPPSGGRTLYWHYPLDRPHFLGGRSAGAIRDNDWKLIEFFDTGEAELYALADDVAEQNNLAAARPDVTKRLQTQLAEWRAEVEARTPSPPLLTTPRQLAFADHFTPGQVSPRWFFSGEWAAENGILRRADDGTGTTRIFLRETEFDDALIRFDFRLHESQDIRLVTGGDGHYNAVIHIRPDHFFIQTALDKSGPYFPSRHGECAIDFDPGRWYTMTVEFLGDRLVAHVDPEHLASAQHPILDRTRQYFAFQVDESAAAFDNVQIFTVGRHPELDRNLDHIEALDARHPVSRSLEDEFEIEKRNAHDRLYRSNARYRELVQQVDALDARNRSMYPEVFRTHKEFHQEVAALRRKLLAEDARYKELLFATHRATRALDEFLIEQDPEVADLPESRRNRELERTRDRFRDDSRYRELVLERDAAQAKLEAAYPQLFLTNEQISRMKKERRQARDDDPRFRTAIQERAAAWQAQQTYLFEHDERLKQLHQRLTAP